MARGGGWSYLFNLYYFRAAEFSKPPFSLLYLTPRYHFLLSFFLESLIIGKLLFFLRKTLMLALAARQEVLVPSTFLPSRLFPAHFSLFFSRVLIL